MLTVNSVAQEYINATKYLLDKQKEFHIVGNKEEHLETKKLTMLVVNERRVLF